MLRTGNQAPPIAAAAESLVKSYWPFVLLAALAAYAYLQMTGRLGGR